VIVRQVERGSIEATVANTRAGTVKPCRRALLAPAAGGQIARLPVRKGQAVKAGELLLALWNEDLAAEVELAASDVRASTARGSAACLKAEISERQAARYSALQKSHAVSDEQVDQIITTARAERAECVAAKAATQVSRDREAAARAHMERTLLLAPFDGVIAEINGELTSLNAFTARHPDLLC
jgi:HlyD family secretion protein